MPCGVVRGFAGLCALPRIRPSPGCGNSRLPTAPVDDGPMETVAIPEVRKAGGLIGAELSGLEGRSRPHGKGDDDNLG